MSGFRALPRQALLSAFAMSVAFIQPAAARELTFGQRVRVQTALERIAWSHQTGETRPFEQAVPRALIEKRVRTTLRQSIALDNLWRTPVTAEMLRREMERMFEGSRMPERLAEIAAATGNDPFLFQECVARPALVDRLARRFFATDDRIHAEVRRQAEALRLSILSGEVDPGRPHRVRRVVELVNRESGVASAEATPGAARHDLAAADYERERLRVPYLRGVPSEPVEEDRSINVRVLLEQREGYTRFADYALPKRSWDFWWSTVEWRFDERQVSPAAGLSLASLPSPARTTSDFSPGDAASCVPDDSWDNGFLDDVPDARTMSPGAAVWTGQVMIVWARGYGGGKYDPATDTWQPVSVVDAPPDAISSSLVWAGDRMIVWGGQSGGFSFLNSGGEYDPINDHWTATESLEAPTGRSEHTAVWTGTEMIVWGGIRGHGAAAQLRSGGRYNPKTRTWKDTRLTTAPGARTAHTAVWTGDRMIVWGGGFDPNAYGLMPLRTGAIYTPATDAWQEVTASGAPGARMSHAAVWTGRAMLVFGGTTFGDKGTLGGSYDPELDAWTLLPRLGGPGDTSYQTAVWSGSEMIVWGVRGLGSTNQVQLNARFDPIAFRWNPVSLINAPSPRDFHAAVWTGTLMIIWGSGRTDIGGRYSPTTDTWTPTSTGPSPAAPRGVAAAWTGTVMLAWGGQLGFSFPPSLPREGYRYDPALDHWSAISTVDAPAGRTGFAWTWSGSALLVWGGFDGFGLRDDGGAYDALQDSWHPLSNTGAPSARQAAAAIWTGDLFIVWGGVDGTGHVDSGGRYNPLTNTWSPISLVGAPIARSLHTATWTGQEMIVWGGWNPSISPLYGIADGARYDPALDEWRSMSIVPVAGRQSHSAIWTGSELIVWGGLLNGSWTATGGIYDPATDSWRTTSSVSSPSKRSLHTAVWTGREMVVWAGSMGSFGNFAVNDGGRYDPLTDTWAPTSTLWAPSPRGGHVAVWTGGMMIVWSSDLGHRSGGRYFLGQSLDDDGDGYSECALDCNDGNAEVHPGALEACDGVDNDCSGAADEPFDADGDGHPICLGDCDDFDAGAFAVAGEVRGLHLQRDRVTLFWDSAVSAAGSGTTHDVVRGHLSELPVGAGVSELCLFSQEPGWIVQDPETPAPGEGFWYLVRGTNGCGAGTWGSASSGPERISTACP